MESKFEFLWVSSRGLVNFPSLSTKVDEWNRVTFLQGRNVTPSKRENSFAPRNELGTHRCVALASLGSDYSSGEYIYFIHIYIFP